LAGLAATESGKESDGAKDLSPAGTTQSHCSAIKVLSSGLRDNSVYSHNLVEPLKGAPADLTIYHFLICSIPFTI
jgi:hypothetical protein